MTQEVLDFESKKTSQDMVFDFLKLNAGVWYTGFEIRAAFLYNQILITDESVTRYCRTLRKSSAISSQKRLNTNRIGKPFTEFCYIDTEVKTQQEV